MLHRKSIDSFHVWKKTFREDNIGSPGFCLELSRDNGLVQSWESSNTVLLRWHSYWAGPFKTGFEFLESAWTFKPLATIKFIITKSSTSSRIGIKAIRQRVQTDRNIWFHLSQGCQDFQWSKLSQFTREKPDAHDLSHSFDWSHSLVSNQHFPSVQDEEMYDLALYFKMEAVLPPDWHLALDWSLSLLSGQLSHKASAARLTIRRVIWILSAQPRYLQILRLFGSCQLNQYMYKYWDGDAVYSWGASQVQPSSPDDSCLLMMLPSSPLLLLLILLSSSSSASSSALPSSANGFRLLIFASIPL